MLALFEMAAVIIVGTLFYRYHRQVLARLRRFDAANRARREQEIRDRYDALAHFRHTLSRAEEQVEPVNEVELRDERTGTPVKRFVFEAETFATKAEAERVREAKVRALARNFYLELPRALAARPGDGRLN